MSSSCFLSTFLPLRRHRGPCHISSRKYCWKSAQVGSYWKRCHRREELWLCCSIFEMMSLNSSLLPSQFHLLHTHPSHIHCRKSLNRPTPPPSQKWIDFLCAGWPTCSFTLRPGKAPFITLHSRHSAGSPTIHSAAQRFGTVCGRLMAPSMIDCWIHRRCVQLAR